MNIYNLKYFFVFGEHLKGVEIALSTILVPEQPVEIDSIQP